MAALRESDLAGFCRMDAYYDFGAWSDSQIPPIGRFLLFVIDGVMHKYFQLRLIVLSCLLAIKLFLRLNPKNPPSEPTFAAALIDANACVGKLKPANPFLYSGFKRLLTIIAARDLILSTTQPSGFNLADHQAFVACAREHEETGTLRLTVRLLRWLYPRILHRNPDNNAQLCLHYLQSLQLNP